MAGTGPDPAPNPAGGTSQHRWLCLETPEEYMPHPMRTRHLVDKGTSALQRLPFDPALHLRLGDPCASLVSSSPVSQVKQFWDGARRGIGLAHLFQEEPDRKQGSEQKKCTEDIWSSVWVILEELHPTKEVWVTPSWVRQKPPEGRSNDDSYVERHWQEQEGSGLVSLGPLAN